MADFKSVDFMEDKLNVFEIRVANLGGDELHKIVLESPRVRMMG